MVGMPLGWESWLTICVVALANVYCAYARTVRGGDVRAGGDGGGAEGGATNFISKKGSVRIPQWSHKGWLQQPHFKREIIVTWTTALTENLAPNRLKVLSREMGPIWRLCVVTVATCGLP